MQSTHWFDLWLRAVRFLAAVTLIITLSGCGTGDDGNDAAHDASAGANDAASADANNPTGDIANDASDDAADNVPSNSLGNGVQNVAVLTQYMPNSAVVAVTFRPRQILESDVAKTLGSQFNLEGLLAMARGVTGSDPRNVEQVLIAAARPGPSQLKGTVNATGVVTFKTPVDLRAILEELPMVESVEERKLPGMSYLLAFPRSDDDPGYFHIGQQRLRAAFYSVNEKTYVFGGEQFVLAVIDRGPSTAGSVAHRLAKADLSADLVIVVSLFGQEVLLQQAERLAQFTPLSEQVGPAFEILRNTAAITVTARVAGGNLLTATLELKDATAATGFENQATKSLDTLRNMYQLQRPLIAQTPELVTFADKVVEGLAVSRDGNSVTVIVPNPGGLADATTGAIPLIEKLLQEESDNGATDFSNIDVKPAKIRVTWREADLLKNGLEVRKGTWVDVPKRLLGAKVYVRYTEDRPAKPDLKANELEIKVLSDGFVAVAAGWRNDARPDPSWIETRSTQKDLMANGWKAVGNLTRRLKSGRPDRHVLLIRKAKAGETIRFHTRKFNPPYALELSASQIKELLESQTADKTDN